MDHRQTALGYDQVRVAGAAKNLQADVQRVTSIEPQLVVGDAPAEKMLVLIGTLGKSPVIDKLVSEKKPPISLPCFLETGRAICRRQKSIETSLRVLV